MTLDASPSRPSADPLLHPVDEVAGGISGAFGHGVALPNTVVGGSEESPSHPRPGLCVAAGAWLCAADDDARSRRGCLSASVGRTVRARQLKSALGLLTSRPVLVDPKGELNHDPRTKSTRKTRVWLGNLHTRNHLRASGLARIFTRKSTARTRGLCRPLHACAGQNPAELTGPIDSALRPKSRSGQPETLPVSLFEDGLPTSIKDFLNRLARDEPRTQVNLWTASGDNLGTSPVSRQPATGGTAAPC